MFLIGRKRNNFKFTEKTHSKKAVAALTVSIGMIIMYVAFLALAYRGSGNLSAYYGSAGVLAMLVSFITLIFSIQSLFEENSFPFFPRLSLFSSLLALVCWVGTYVLGFI